MTRAVLAAALAAVGLVALYAGLGGGDHDLERPPDPCTRAAPDPRPGLVGDVERIGLTALDATACELGVSRERLVLVLTGDVPPPADLTDGERDEAFREGLRETVIREQEAGRIGGDVATALLVGIDFIPVEQLLDQVFDGG